MKSGIIRRTDDLGRVVITREIRKALGWVEGTPLEEVVTEDGVLLRPYRSHEDVCALIVACTQLIEDNKDQYSDTELYNSIIDHLKQAYDAVKEAAKLRYRYMP